jgi:hypothetical protein
MLARAGPRTDPHGQRNSAEQGSGLLNAQCERRPSLPSTQTVEKTGKPSVRKDSELRPQDITVHYGFFIFPGFLLFSFLRQCLSALAHGGLELTV